MAVCAARSDVGRRRTINEDSYIADSRLGLFAVADGMGGHAGGEVASGIAATTLQAFVESSSADAEITWPFGYAASLSIEGNQLRNAIQLANQLIISRATAEPALQTMGSTIIVCLMRQSTIVFGNVGDSRLYLWREDTLRQLSEDDSWAASMLRAGASPEMVSKHEMRHVLTRALGAAQPLDVQIGEFLLEDGDVLLLCSDGLYGPLTDAGIARILSDTGTAVLDTAAEALVDGANAAGGPDNITAILIRYESETTAVMERPAPLQSSAAETIEPATIVSSDVGAIEGGAPESLGTTPSFPPDDASANIPETE